MQKKNVTKFSIQLFICILLLELLLRAVFYQQVGREKLAILEITKNIKRRIIPPDSDRKRVYQNFLIVRPDSGKKVNALIEQEAFASNHFEYSPWTDYKNIDYSGRYINTKGLVRATTPDIYIGPDSVKMKTIYFLGGSTMYGLNITDRETIAAAFVNLYREQFPQGVSIKVVNYGVSAYHSYNELMLLSHLIYSGQKPDIVVMFDGLNDFLMPNAAQKRFPYFYYRLKLAGKDKINFKELEQTGDSTARLFAYPDGAAEEPLADTLVRYYLANVDQVKKLALTNSFDAFFFIQPNPFYKYPNKKADPICDSEQFPLVEKAYQILERKSTGTGNCFFLGNMLVSEKGYPFIDRFHYSPAMCKKIAREIVNIVGEKINGH